MSVVTADPTAAVAIEQTRSVGWLLGVRCALFGAVVVGATAYAAPRVALVRHSEGLVVLGVLLAFALAVRSWREASSKSPRRSTSPCSPPAGRRRLLVTYSPAGSLKLARSRPPRSWCWSEFE